VPRGTYRTFDLYNPSNLLQRPHLRSNQSIMGSPVSQQGPANPVGNLTGLAKRYLGMMKFLIRSAGGGSAVPCM
jgi:hypothetical protein